MIGHSFVEPDYVPLVGMYENQAGALDLEVKVRQMVYDKAGTSDDLRRGSRPGICAELPAARTDVA